MENRTPTNENGFPNRPKELEAYINTLPAIVRNLSANGNCVWFSSQWYTLTGQTEKHALHLGWLDTLHPDARENVFNTLKKAYLNQDPYSIEYRIRQKDGSYCLHLDKASPTHDAFGTFIGLTSLLTSLQDNAEKSKADQHLANHVSDCSPTGLWLSDKVGKLTYLNKTLTEWTGIPYESLLGDGWANAVIEEDRLMAIQAFENAISEQKHYNVLFRIRKGDGTIIWCRAAGDPYFDGDENYAGYSGFCMDVDELLLEKKKLEQSDGRFQELIKEAPFATALFMGRELRIEIANDEMIQIWGKGDSVLGKPLAEALPELKGQEFLEILYNIFETGETYEARDSRAELVVNGIPKTTYLDFSYKPLFNAEGEVYGIMDMAINVTERVIANRQIEETQRQVLASFEQSPVGIAILDKENLVFTLANPFYCELVGKKINDLVNKSLLDALPEIKGKGFDQILYDVIETGNTYTANEVEVEFFRNQKFETIFVNFSYQPQYRTDGSISGVLVVVIDVTVQILSRRKVESSESKLRSVIMNAPAGIGLFVGRDLIIELPNNTFIDIVGKGPDIEGKPLRIVMPELILEDQPFLRILDDVYTTGIMFQSNGSQVKIVKDGVMTYNYYNITYSPLFDENNEIYAIMDIAIDVTDAVLARQQAEGAEASLRNAIELAELATWSFDIRNKTFHYSQRFKDWLGISEEKENLEEAFGILTEPYRIEVDDKIREAVNPNGSGTYNYEHPIINQITGQTRIIHAQGQVFFDKTGNPEILGGSAQDVTQERELQQQLEFEVKKRTEELQETNAELADAIESLQKTNSELAQFAYIASHDLQEPVRKIGMFSKMLENSLGPIDSKSAKYLSKINVSSSRMISLIRDVLSFSELSKEHQTFEAVDLNEIVIGVLSDFDLFIEQKNASVTYGELPVIEAIPLQMSQLFSNLISNSIKYSREGINPVIDISVTELSEQEALKHGISEAGAYCKLEFQDNGIGFDQEHASRIFHIFQRLHGKTEYTGTGIGLAICKKIAENHYGKIYAVAESQKGALFVILLPKRQK